MSQSFKPGDRPRKRSSGPFGQLKSLLSTSPRQRPVEITEDHVLSLLMARRGREAFFGRELFSDPVWDILLELYAAHLGRRAVSVREVTAAIGTPPTATARWVAALSARGLVAAELDQRSSRVWVSLTDEGRSKMKKLADQWGSAFVPI